MFFINYLLLYIYILNRTFGTINIYIYLIYFFFVLLNDIFIKQFLLIIMCVLNVLF